MEAAKKAGDDERKFVQDTEQKFLDEMAAKGMIITKDVDYAAFQKEVAPVYEQYKGKIGADLLNEVLAATKQ